MRPTDSVFSHVQQSLIMQSLTLIYKESLEAMETTEGGLQDTELLGSSFSLDCFIFVSGSFTW